MPEKFNGKILPLITGAGFIDGVLKDQRQIMQKDDKYSDSLFALAAQIGDAMQKADELGLSTVAVHLSSASNECQRKIAEFGRDYSPRSR